MLFNCAVGEKPEITHIYKIVEESSEEDSESVTPRQREAGYQASILVFVHNVQLRDRDFLQRAQTTNGWNKHRKFVQGYHFSC